MVIGRKQTVRLTFEVYRGSRQFLPEFSNYYSNKAFPIRSTPASGMQKEGTLRSIFYTQEDIL